MRFRKWRWPWIWRSAHERSAAVFREHIHGLEQHLAQAQADAQRFARMRDTAQRARSEQEKVHKYWEQREALLLFMENPRSFQAMAVMHETLLLCCDDVTKEMYRAALRKRYGPDIVDPLLESSKPYLDHFRPENADASR